MIYWVILAILMLAVAIGYYIGSKGKSAKLKNTIGLGGIIAACVLILKFFPNVFISFISFFPALLKLIENKAKKNSFNPEQRIYNDASKKDLTKKEACEILGVNENATPHEIKSAFNRLIKKNHPDVGGSNYLTNKLIEAKKTLLGEE